MIALRMCVCCRQMKEKKDLIRVVKTNDGFVIDSSMKMDGRGAYVCKNSECLNNCEKKHLLNKSFKCNVANEIYLKLKEYNE